jgi:hypothetical protein
VQVAFIVDQYYLLERLHDHIVCDLVFDNGGGLAVGHLGVVDTLRKELVHVVFVKMGFPLVGYTLLEGLIVVFVLT